MKSRKGSKGRGRLICGVEWMGEVIALDCIGRKRAMEVLDDEGGDRSLSLVLKTYARNRVGLSAI